MPGRRPLQAPTRTPTAWQATSPHACALVPLILQAMVCAHSLNGCDGRRDRCFGTLDDGNTRHSWQGRARPANETVPYSWRSNTWVLLYEIWFAVPFTVIVSVLESGETL